MNNTELEKQLQIIKKATEHALSLLGVEEKTPTHVHSVAEPVENADTAEVEIDFSMQSRAFFKKYAKGFSGTKVFVLMVAYFMNQQKSDMAPLADIQKEWSKMKGIIKYKYSSAYTVRAKESDWVDSSKSSFYSLRPNWKDIFK
ncbi:MAG: hypothetical protein WC059_00900 [Candidatus Paceibacterota bacterium]